MDVYEYLKNVRKYEKFIADQEQQIEELRTMAEKITPGNSDGMPKGNSVSDKIGNITAKIVDTQNEMYETIEKYIDYKREVIINLRRLPSSQYDVLYKRFVEGKQYADIANEMFLSRQQVWRIRNKAYENLAELINS